LRIAHYEVSEWIYERGAKAKMRALVVDRIARAAPKT